MHAEAHAFIERTVAEYGPFVSVLEIGSRNVNGGVRDLFGGAVYEGVDIVDGDGVDYVCDAAEWLPAGPYDVVVCAETFEHAEGWRRIVENAARVLLSDGVLIVTAAGPGRAEHSAVDGGVLRGGEYYGNVEPAALAGAVMDAGLTVKTCEQNGVDVYLVAVK